MKSLASSTVHSHVLGERRPGCLGEAEQKPVRPGSETTNGHRWLRALLSAADPAWRSQQLLEAIAAHPSHACWTLKSHRLFRRRSNTAKWAQPCKAPRPWSSRACVAECDLWRDLGAQGAGGSASIANVPKRLFEAVGQSGATMGRDGAVGTAVGSLVLKSVLRCAGWVSGPFAGFLRLDDYLDCVALLVEDTRVKTQCGVQCEVGPCRTLVKHLDKAGTDRMFAPRGV